MCVCVMFYSLLFKNLVEYPACHAVIGKTQGRLRRMRPASIKKEKRISDL